jgi:hypothetical protein
MLAHLVAARGVCHVLHQGQRSIVILHRSVSRSADSSRLIGLVSRSTDSSQLIGLGVLIVRARIGASAIDPGAVPDSNPRLTPT